MLPPPVAVDLCSCDNLLITFVFLIFGSIDGLTY